MKSLLRPALSLFILLSVVTGLLYPMLVNGLTSKLFSSAAQGSLLVSNDKLVGSALIGQNFTTPEYFWGRPSATAPQPYNATASGGSNQGPSNPALVEAVNARIEALHAAEPDNKLPIPADLVLSSASGLDPEISPAAALYQAGRIARARNLPQEKVTALIEATQQGRQWGLFGEPRVNVLTLNLALDAMQGK